VTREKKFKEMIAKPGKKPDYFLLDLFLDPEDGSGIFV
jgi:hypothetical protein